jgi:hypothetical protein
LYDDQDSPADLGVQEHDYINKLGTSDASPQTRKKLNNTAFYDNLGIDPFPESREIPMPLDPMERIPISLRPQSSSVIQETHIEITNKKSTNDKTKPMTDNLVFFA